LAESLHGVSVACQGHGFRGGNIHAGKACGEGFCIFHEHSLLFMEFGTEFIVLQNLNVGIYIFFKNPSVFPKDNCFLMIKVV
jgi:hypothetical protein